MCIGVSDFDGILFDAGNHDVECRNEHTIPGSCLALGNV